ncbi:NAD(P)/FAD-dependent oxidoreductase [Paenibacillus sp. TRM 82003]|uniref:flavin-containing monooxygenase n=1 Tax=Kineococcus sp. TRM81007 TaxID=2925831 RepID=UPI001F5700B3|nr:NAD(P)/FAD-dependent oxidoreductase [Kineococcus sp. TRM81007]MCI2237333.1 NAD(P)/FAD-dependent oxidoreductase [Kineococcus sp. TRM81007]MCI3926560.1 NAD(P)/FAD-dependent oxidoreductase [Paenibacillus sp. TRM 82003]
MTTPETLPAGTALVVPAQPGPSAPGRPGAAAAEGGTAPARPAAGSAVPHVHVAVVGSGFSGIAASIRLTQEGFDDHVLLERADEVGGTWRDNDYPGAGCDVMSLLYSLSFAPKADWRTTFGSREEIYGYLRETAERFGVRDRTLFGHDLLDAAWDGTAKRWRLTTSRGRYTCDVLVVATGYLSDPAVPDLPGLGTFTGEVFHTSRWNHDLDLTGRRVAVVGTGASAVQAVPHLQRVASQLTVYQRTPAWVAPKSDKPTTAAELLLRRRVPGYQALRRGVNMWGREALAFMMARPAVMRRTLQTAALKNLHSAVPEGPLREALTPDHTIGCKRVLFSNTYYPALVQPNVELVAAGVEQVRPGGLVADGKYRPADVVVLATGFEAVERPVARRVRGADGRTLAERWGRRVSAFAGTSVSGFPNLFMLLGPNTALAHSAQTVMIEAQVEHLVSALRCMRERGAAAVEVLPAAEEAFQARLAEHFRGSVWEVGGCRSWYQDADGHNPSLWPTYTWRYRREVSRFRPADHRLTTCAATPAATPSTHADPGARSGAPVTPGGALA